MGVSGYNPIISVTFNRTIVELKLLHIALHIPGSCSFNRTIVELKLERNNVILLPVATNTLLIEPLWN